MLGGIDDQGAVAFAFDNDAQVAGGAGFGLRQAGKQEQKDGEYINHKDRFFSVFNVNLLTF